MRPGRPDRSRHRTDVRRTGRCPRPHPRYAAEAAAVGLGRNTDLSAEVLAQHYPGVEADAAGDLLHTQVGLLQQAAGGQDPLLIQPFVRGDPRLGDESPGEGPLAHHGLLRQRRRRVRLTEVIQRPGEQWSQTVGGALRDRHGHELLLIPVPLGRDDHPARDLGRDRGAQFAADQVQTGVDAGRRACAGDDVVLFDEEGARVDLRRREAPLHFGGVHPVRRAPAPVQQSGGPQRERCRAKTQQGRPFGVHRAEQLEDLGRIFGVFTWRARGDDDQIAARNGIQTAVRRDGETGEVLRGQGSPGFERAHPEVEVRHALLTPVDAEHLHGHAELEHRNRFQHDDTHLRKGHPLSIVAVFFWTKASLPLLAGSLWEQDNCHDGFTDLHRAGRPPRRGPDSGPPAGPRPPHAPHRTAERARRLPGRPRVARRRAARPAAQSALRVPAKASRAS